MDKKIKVYMSPEKDNYSFSTLHSNGHLGIAFVMNGKEDTFLSHLGNIIEMKNENADQKIYHQKGEFFMILTLQEIKDELQLKYWMLNEDIHIATAFIEMVIKQKDYNKLCDMYSLFKMNKDYINKYISIIQSDNFRYNELRRLFENGRLILN